MPYPADTLPVFIFHTVHSGPLERQLRFLKNNGYATVGADEAHAFLRSGAPLPEKSVMLTLDDGRQSAWAVAYPLLKKYGFRATVFLSPGILREDGIVSANLDDVTGGKADSRSVEDCDGGRLPMISWEEAEIMHRSGIVDFQAHCWDHRKVPVGPRVEDFVNPKRAEEFYFAFSVPAFRDREVRVSDHPRVLGAPVYRADSQFSGRRRYLEEVDLTRRCIEWVGDRGGARAFDSLDWRAELSGIVRDHRRNHPVPVARETEEEQVVRMTENLTKTKRAIEGRLPGARVRHFAYPWGRGSDAAREASKRAGFVSNYWSMIPGRSSNRPGDDPFRIVRLKHDFIERLPGDGRVSLKELFLHKTYRRLSGKIDY